MILASFILATIIMILWAAFQMAAPQTAHEQELDDQEQLQYIRNYWADRK